MGCADAPALSPGIRRMGTAAAVSYAAIAVDMLAAILYTPWMIGRIGQSAYSLFTLSASLVSMFTLDFGISSAVTRFAARYVAEGDQQAVDRLLGLVYKLYLGITAALLGCLLTVYFLLDILYARLTPGELEVFRGIYLIAASYSVLSFPFLQLNGILTAYERLTFLKSCELGKRVVTVGLIIWALLSGRGVYALVALNAVGGLAAVAAKLLYIARRTPIRVEWRYADRSRLRQLLAFSGWITVISVMQRFGMNFAPTVLANVAGSAQIALFGVARTVEGYEACFENALSSFFLPKVSRLLAAGGDPGTLTELMIRVGRIQFCIIGLIVVGFAGVGREFLDAWIGPDYAGVYGCVLALIVPSLFYAPQEIANTALLAMNKVAYKAYAFIGGAGINIAAAFILGRLWGAWGVSLSVGLTAVARMVYLNGVYHRKLGIDMLRFARETYLRLLAPLLAALLGAAAVHLLTPLGGWTGVAVKAALIAAVYGLSMAALGMNAYERALVREAGRGLRRRLTRRP